MKYAAEYLNILSEASRPKRTELVPLGLQYFRGKMDMAPVKFSKSDFETAGAWRIAEAEAQSAAKSLRADRQDLRLLDGEFSMIFSELPDEKFEESQFKVTREGWARSGAKLKLLVHRSNSALRLVRVEGEAFDGYYWSAKDAPALVAALNSYIESHTLG
jgi:hypothetical protein